MSILRSLERVPMRCASMILAFQEPVKAQASRTDAKIVQANLADQALPLMLGTRTITETREEMDQDPAPMASTMTQTKTIEEPDQDRNNAGLFVFPRP
jgi:hypothetical protein